jgi:hypothetical protein
LQHSDVNCDPLFWKNHIVGRQTGQRTHPGPKELAIAGCNLDNNPDELAFVNEILEAHGYDPKKIERGSVEWRKALHELSMKKSTMPLHYDQIQEFYGMTIRECD